MLATASEVASASGLSKPKETLADITAGPAYMCDRSNSVAIEVVLTRQYRPPWHDCARLCCIRVLIGRVCFFLKTHEGAIEDIVDEGHARLSNFSKCLRKYFKNYKK